MELMFEIYQAYYYSALKSYTLYNYNYVKLSNFDWIRMKDWQTNRKKSWLVINYKNAFKNITLPNCVFLLVGFIDC